MKSRTALLEDINNELKNHHPYEVFELIATPIIGGNKEYINWVLDNTKGDKKEEKGD